MRRIVIAAAAAAAFLAPHAHAQDAKTEVKVGVTDRPDNASLFLAYRRGYFDREGIKITFVGGGSAASDFVSALGLNQVQVAAGSPNAGFFNALNRGINIRIVADWSHVGGPEDKTFSLLARTDLMESGAIKTLADLKGRTIAVGPSHGSVNDIMIAEALKKGGLGLTDANLVLMGFADGIAAMASRKIDAALLIEPLVTQAETKGVAKMLAPAGAVIPGYELAVVYYSPEFAHDTDLATRYMIAYLEGRRDFYDAFFAKKDREDAIKILAQDLPRVPPELWRSAEPSAADLNGEVNVDNIIAQGKIYKAADEISGPVPDIRKYVDPQFAEAAVKKIGRR
ncbi:MAG TPA: ABC transporter substrate-binding protein [Stellaceae bacterium]|nr:ABC transporter substrate-binding protein [Stellaceae bacterium]